MSAAEREAERRFPLWLPTGDYEIYREDYSELDAEWQNADTERDRAHFVQGAEWQAERDAVRIAELEAEVEQWRRVAAEQTRLERDRAEAAEAKLAAVRALHQPIELIHADAPAFPHRTLVCTECGTDKGQWRAWPCATIQAIEGDQT